MYFNIINFFNTTDEEKYYLIETHLFYKKLIKLKYNIQNNPYDVNYKFLRLMNHMNEDLYKIQKIFISRINEVLIDKLFYNFHNATVVKKILNKTFYNDISNIILDYSPSGNKLIFIKLHNHKNFLIIKNIKFFKNLLKNAFITQIYIEQYDLHKGLTIKDLTSFKPVYDFNKLSFTPTNINDISYKTGFHNLILITIKYHYRSNLGFKKHKSIDFFIHSIEQLHLIESFLKKKNKFIFCNFTLYSIKTIETDFVHKIHLNLKKIQEDIFTIEIYNYLMKLLINTNKNLNFFYY
jgi:hypothetical protein